MVTGLSLNFLQLAFLFYAIQFSRLEVHLYAVKTQYIENLLLNLIPFFFPEV